MAAKRYPVTLTDIKAGMFLKFIRRTMYGNAYLARGAGRTCYILEGDEGFNDGIVLVAFRMPVRNIFGQPAQMFEHEGFKHCLYVSKQTLINNCKEI